MSYDYQLFYLHLFSTFSLVFFIHFNSNCSQIYLKVSIDYLAMSSNQIISLHYLSLSNEYRSNHKICLYLKLSFLNFNLPISHRCYTGNRHYYHSNLFVFSHPSFTNFRFSSGFESILFFQLFDTAYAFFALQCFS